MKYIVASLLLAIVFMSCNKDSPNEEPVNESLLTLYFNAHEEVESKAVTPLLTQTGDNNLDKVVVFVFNSSTGVVETIRVVITPDLIVNNIAIASPVGVKDIYIVGNPSNSDMSVLTSIASVNDLKQKTFDLKNEKEGSFVMIGKVLGVTVSAGTTNNAQINMSRASARVHLTNITAQFTGEMIGKTVSIDTIYLLRSIGKKSYGDSTIVVTPELVYNRVVSGFQFQNYDIFSTPINVSSNQTFAATQANGVHYYTYSNPASTFAQATKLVIAAKVNGVRTYYPVAVNISGNGYNPTTHTGIRANYDYKVSVTIKGMGVNDPNTAVSGNYCSILLTPKVWNIFNEQVTYQ